MFVQLLQFFSIALNVGAAWFNLTQSIKQHKVWIKRMEEVDKNFKSSLKELKIIQVLKENLLTYCEKCRALIKLKK